MDVVEAMVNVFRQFLFIGQGLHPDGYDRLDLVRLDYGEVDCRVAISQNQHAQVSFLFEDNVTRQIFVCFFH